MTPAGCTVAPTAPTGTFRAGRAREGPEAVHLTKRGARSTSLGSHRISHSKFVTKWFLEYLSKTAQYRFKVIGRGKTGKVTKYLSYIHRWTETYQRSMVAKFCRLDEWIRDNPNVSKVATMLTLTVYQTSESEKNDGSYSRKIKGRDISYQESLKLLLVSRKKLLNVLRNRYPGINYVWILEPHKTGNAHCHLLILKELSEPEQNSLKELWSRKYQAGSRKHGVKISESKKTDEIVSMKNYLMKYMGKQFGIGSDGWSKGDLLFNAMMWYTKTRMWGASKELTAVMRKPEIVSDVEWNSVELLKPQEMKLPNGETRVIECSHLVWQRDNGEPFPVLDDPDISDPDDFIPLNNSEPEGLYWKRVFHQDKIFEKDCRLQTEWSKKKWGM